MSPTPATPRLGGPGWAGRSPQSVPVPSAGQGDQCLRGGRALLALLRLGLWSSSLVAKVSWRRRRKSDLSHSSCKETFVSPALSPPLGAGHPPAAACPAWTGQSFAAGGSVGTQQGSPHLQPQSGGKVPGSCTLPGSHLLSPAPEGAGGDGAFWARGDISGGFLLSRGLIHFPLPWQGDGKASLLPLSPSLLTSAVWQGHGHSHGRWGSIAKSPRAWPVGFVFLLSFCWQQAALPADKCPQLSQTPNPLWGNLPPHCRHRGTTNFPFC